MGVTKLLPINQRKEETTRRKSTVKPNQLPRKKRRRNLLRNQARANQKNLPRNPKVKVPGLPRNLLKEIKNLRKVSSENPKRVKVPKNLMKVKLLKELSVLLILVTWTKSSKNLEVSSLIK